MLSIVALSSAARADQCERIPVWRDAQIVGVVCRADAAANGLTVVDLGEDWVPPVLERQPDGGPAYRATYLALAQERFDDAGADGTLAKSDRYLELYGIEPSLEVVHARLADTARHRCHAAIGRASLAAAPARIVEEPKADALARAASSKRYRDAVRAAQSHLACDRLFDAPAYDGAYTWQTSNAIGRFQKGVMILPTGVLDAQTRIALVRDSRERDWATALRVLRARVSAAAGLVEDGTAGAGQDKVLGLMLEPEGTWRVRGSEPLDDAAPDLISAATETAARALGWTSPAATLEFLDDLTSGASSQVVAIELPSPPLYHSPTMALAITIDRGDVWVDPEPRDRDAAHRAAVIVYAWDGSRRIPLARWPTTVGGWQDSQNGDDIAKDWKESPVGPRVWRELLVGPSWLPAPTIPDRELVRAGDDGWELAREQFGPSYRSAFGYVAFVHRDDQDEDEGIRTHGTANLTSLANNVSHGCHRMLGLHVVRLANFLLAHHRHVARGDQRTAYSRVIHHGGDEFPVKIDTLGYELELVPPVPVEVLPGRIHRGER